MTVCVIYLDDLILFADSFEEHMYRLNLVLTGLKQCNLKLSPQKCTFIQEKVGILGHIVSADGKETDLTRLKGSGNGQHQQIQMNLDNFEPLLDTIYVS